MDVLSNILSALHLHARVFSHGCYRGEWALDTSGEKRTTFHLLIRGSCWLHLPEQKEPIALSGGDLIVFPHDAAHILSNSPQLPKADFPLNLPADPAAEGVAATLVCGYFHFERCAWNPLLEALPEWIFIRYEESNTLPLMETLGKFLQYELDADNIGVDLVVDKLSEILFINVVRRFVKDYEGGGYIAALADKQIGKALSAVHQNLQEKWSVESLAQVAGMSRSSFAEKFVKLTGHTPMNYLTKWRMTIAQERLVHEKESVVAVAEASGYQSEAAFSKTFKKHFGYGPGAARKRG